MNRTTVKRFRKNKKWFFKRPKISPKKTIQPLSNILQSLRVNKVNLRRIKKNWKIRLWVPKISTKFQELLNIYVTSVLIWHVYALYKTKDFERNFKGHKALKVPFQNKVQLAPFSNVKSGSINKGMFSGKIIVQYTKSRRVL